MINRAGAGPRPFLFAVADLHSRDRRLEDAGYFAHGLALRKNPRLTGPTENIPRLQKII